MLSRVRFSRRLPHSLQARPAPVPATAEPPFGWSVIDKHGKPLQFYPHDSTAEQVANERADRLNQSDNFVHYHLHPFTVAPLYLHPVRADAGEEADHRDALRYRLLRAADKYEIELFEGGESEFESFLKQGTTLDKTLDAAWIAHISSSPTSEPVPHEP